MGNQPRFRFVQDDSCHWYAIPADKEAAFEAWVSAMQYDEYYESSDHEDFSDFRLDLHPSSYSFTDLKEDRE